MSRAVVIGLVIGASLLAETPPRAEVTMMDAVAHAVSAPLRDTSPFAPGLPPQAANVIGLRKAGGSSRPGGGGGGGSWTDPVKQSSYPTTPKFSLVVNVDGISADGSIPPDTNLAVGATQVVETVNTEYAVYDKTGTLKFGPFAIHTIFTGLGGMCATADGGDPIVLYDQADGGHWMISQLEYNNSFTSNLVCIAVSSGPDAIASTYNLYAFDFGSNLPDYPKFAVWPDAYYFSANMFHNGSSFAGAKACAFDRNAMIAGRAASAVCFQGTTSLYNLLPSNLDGSTSPSPGESNFFLQFVSNALNLYKFHVDFTTPGNSTFMGTSIPVASFHQACGGGTCVPQLGTTKQLDSLADRLMYRLSYRNFGTYESLLVNHSVQVSSSSNQTGIRWYEIRNPNGTPTLNQQSTFSPSDGVYRWMGSIAQDKAGNMLLGYSASSSTLYPGIRVTGRQPSDGTGVMEQEFVLSLSGAGSQTTYSRWGDYASMAVDPIDNCTFWFATEYLPYTGVFNWNTRIASFKFSTCS